MDEGRMPTSARASGSQPRRILEPTTQYPQPQPPPTQEFYQSLSPGTARIMSALVTAPSSMKRRAQDDPAEPAQKHDNDNIPETNHAHISNPNTTKVAKPTPKDADLEISNTLLSRHQKNIRYAGDRIAVHRLIYIPDWYDKASMESELAASKTREKRWLHEKAALERDVQASTIRERDRAENERVKNLKLLILDTTRRFFMERIFRYDVRIEMYRLKNGPQTAVVNGVRRPIETLRGDEWRDVFNYRGNSWNHGAGAGLTSAESGDADLLNHRSSPEDTTYLLTKMSNS